MTRILRIDASSRAEDSHSRQFADRFLESWFQIHPNDELVVRDLARHPVPHIAAATIAGFYTPPEAFTDEARLSTALSDELIAELRAADLLLISTPMYNFSLPSALKAWIDQVVRIGHTFSFSPESGFTGLLSGKRAIIVTASGAAFSSEAMRPMNFLAPYLKTLLGFLGFREVEVISLEGTTIDAAALERSQAAAQAQIARLAGQARTTPPVHQP
jgi:FMN-dependent NADH-azoreductase